jgi:hypothetical protein
MFNIRRAFMTDPLPENLAKAFEDAVLEYENWHPQFEGRRIPIGSQFFPLEVVGDLVSKFTDPLPEHVFMQLRSYMQEEPHGDLIADLERRPTYDVGSLCLRRLIERRREANRG